MKRAFKNEKEFKTKVKEYIDYCHKEERFVNIAGLCAYLDINRDTFYQQKEYYSDTYKKVQEILEDETLNNRNTDTRITLIYLKNKFDYKDKVETENTNHNTNKNIDLSNYSTEELKKLIANED